MSALSGSAGARGPAADLRAGIRAALGRERARANIRRAMGGLVVKRLKAFPDAEELERLRGQGEAIREDALERLPELLERLEARCTENGMRVHWAESASDANATVLAILKAAGARALLKGKSMVSEEMGLNLALEAAGIEPVETDLGELIIQLAGEPPSHIIAPAVHKDRHEVAELFRERLPEPPNGAAIEDLTAAARRYMRERFRDIRFGLSGVNFAVAETGTLCLVENEGNGRLSTTAPDIHIAVMGIEKVIPRLADLPPLLTLLTRSATGQPVTAYVNLISGPRRPGERDGPGEVHLVLLDNGRSRIHADPELRATLRCIRCGACMNHCPIYTRLGGHAYGTVYPGPIGSILEPQLHGLAAHGAMAHASTLCGACAEVCPVKIPIPRLLNRLRSDAAGGDPEGPARRPVPTQAPSTGAGLDAPTAAEDPTAQVRPRDHLAERLVWRLWAFVYADPRRYRAFARLASALRALTPRRIGPWTRTRAAPRPSQKDLHRLAREAEFDSRT